MTTRRPPELLLAEDDDEDAELAFAALALAGVAEKVARARDGQEVLDYLKGEGRHAERRGLPPPRVLILDLKMPRLSGFDVLGAVRALPSLKCLPVVVMTSSRDESDVRRCCELGANSYVVKPVRFEEFSDTLARVALYWLRVNVCPRATTGPC